MNCLDCHPDQMPVLSEALEELSAWLGTSHPFTEVCDGDRAFRLSA